MILMDDIRRRRLRWMASNGGRAPRGPWSERARPVAERNYEIGMFKLRLLGLVVPCGEGEYELTPSGWEEARREGVKSFQSVIGRKRKSRGYWRKGWGKRDAVVRDV